MDLGAITPTFGDLLDLKSLYAIDIYKIFSYFALSFIIVIIYFHPSL